ncbi:hypothetical protein ACN4EK_28490, partial [Pantanalinema rosaneae CENA516]|uniref:hypothetical protein n=1 Tax=Pantanalinema rosaneae TaxID=1620701 RepID=UPI003D6E5371
IGFPSEWGQYTNAQYQIDLLTFPFNWVPQRVGTNQTSKDMFGSSQCFHSMWFPASGNRQP